MPRKRKTETERVATTNIKVTVPTHKELQVAAQILGKTQSEVISLALRALMPNLTDEVNRREELRRASDTRSSRSSQN